MDIATRPPLTEQLAALYRWPEIEGWRLLEQHFDLTEGFAFIVVLAPDDDAVALVREHLSTLFPEPGAVLRIPFDPNADTAALTEALLAATPTAAIRVVWIDTDPVAPEDFEVQKARWSAALGRLNRYRNSVSARFTTTVALALPARLLSMLRETAPDLWSIRSGLFRIEPPGASRAAFQWLPEGEWQTLEDNAEISGDPAETLAAAAQLRGKPGRETLLATLLQRAGNQARHRLDWQTALAALQEAYTLQETAGADPELRWNIATDLANVFSDVAQYDRAEFYLRRALQTAEQHFGATDTKTAVTLNNLAQLLKTACRFAEAEPLMRRAIVIFEQLYGDQDPSVAFSINNLAGLLLDTNRLEEAEPLMRRALAIDEQTHGEQHPTVARDLNNLAQLMKLTNRLAEAEPLMRRALVIDESAFGDQHPIVAIRLNNLAQLLQDDRRFAESEAMMRRALAIDEHTYGERHPKVAVRLNNLSMLLAATNRLKEAEPLMRRALEIDEQFYGNQHPTFALDLNNLAGILLTTNRLAEAEPMLRRALAIYNARLGTAHPSSQTAADNLRRLLEKR